MASITLLIAIFGGSLFLASIANAIKLTYYMNARISESWGMIPQWYVEARNAGWLRDGRNANCVTALVGAVILAVGMYFWNFQPVSDHGEALVLAVSVIAILIGFIGLSVEDGYSVAFKTLRLFGCVGLVVGVILISIS